MSKQINSSRYILKINSSRLRINKWNLDISIEEARNLEEVVSIGDSQILDFIRVINDDKTTEEDIRGVKKEIKEIKKKETNEENINLIKQKYEELDKLIFIRDYVAIEFDRISDFDRATNTKKGFIINGENFRRIVGTTGGIKSNTVIFCSEKIYKKLNYKLENERDKSVPLVPAKFEAYKALSTSVSTPVTSPRGVLVIKDGSTFIKDKVIKVSDDGDGGFKVEHNIEYETTKDFADGCGMIRKELAEQWAIDLGLYIKDNNGNKVAEYVPSGFNTRFSYEKGMVGVFEFEKFGKEVANTYIVKDAWGNNIDVRKVDLVITTNMLKLWNAYDSVEDYLEKSYRNGYQWRVTKACPNVLEESRNTNYQYLQSYEDISTDDINKLIKPTVDDINGVLGEDIMKTILFARGSHIDNKNITKSDYDYTRALMIDKRMIEDPFVKQNVYKSIEKRIKESKKGVLRFEGNYSIIFGDLYALCESMFGMEVKGLLKSNEFYSRHWLDKKVNEVIAFRSPMTSHNNIRRLKLVEDEKINKWFKYLKTVVIFNAWDTTTDALNGADFDSDAIITTNNDVLLRNTKDKQTIICEQKSVSKEIITEGKLKKSNKNGFGDDIGTITNRVTGMFDVLAGLKKDSEEYKEVSNRIICGQAYQQESIDKIKGIEAKKMPKEWYDYKANKIKDEDNEEIKLKKERNIKTMVNKKPYFFIYNYENIRNKYNLFIKNVNNNAIIRYGMTFDELEKKDNKDEDEVKFLLGAKYRSPVFSTPSTMNRICTRLEEEFKDVKLKVKQNNFDKEILKTDKKYSKNVFNETEKLYKEYKKQLKQYSQTVTSKTSTQDKKIKKAAFKDSFKRKADIICPNSEDLCNIVIDIAYKSNNSKQFAWDVSGEQIIRNLLMKNNWEYKYPTISDDGDVEWNGKKYKVETLKVEDN